VPPTRATLARDRGYFVAGRAYNVSCAVRGSHPPADVVAAVGGRSLDVEEYSVTDDNASAVARVAFTPSRQDDGRMLACRAENPHLGGGHAVEDQWRIQVHCEFTNGNPDPQKTRSLPLPVFTDPPQLTLSLPSYRATRVEVNEGDRLELKCNAVANPILGPETKITWKINVIKIPNEFKCTQFSQNQFWAGYTSTNMNTRRVDK